jgi:hypothetical protein
VIVGLAGAACCAASAQTLTVKDLVAKTLWVKNVLKSARAQFAEKTLERNLGATVNYDAVIDWAVFYGKTYRKEVSRSVDGAKSGSLNTTIFDGNDTISIYATLQPDGKTVDRQIERRPGHQFVVDIFAGAFEVHDLPLPDALASGKYSIVRQSPTEIELDGVYQANQKIKFILSPADGYLVRRAEIYGDGRFSQIQSIDKFARTGDFTYPKSGKLALSFEGSSTPTNEVAVNVSSFEAGPVPAELFAPDFIGGTVTDSVTREIYQVKDGRKVVVGHTKNREAAKTPSSGSPYGLALLSGCSVLVVAFGIRSRAKLNTR